MHPQFRLNAFLVGCGLAAVALPGLAQSTRPEVEEIIVTAQHREQDVQDVPIAIDVISGEEMAKAGFSDMNSIDKIAPAVQLNQDQGTVKITMRGVGTNSNDEAQDTSVVINIDGEYINRPNVLGVAMFDMERVEVLRGPQGTLYGRNSTGGAINFITRKPGDEFGGNVSVSYGDYDAIRADAGVDIPLGSVGAMRVSGFYDKRDGYVDHPSRPGFFVFPAFDGGESDDNDASGGRVSFRLRPTDALSIDLAGEAATREFTPQLFAATDLNAPGNAPTGPGCNAPGYTQVAPLYPQTLCVPSGTNFLDDIDRDEYDAPNYGMGKISEDTYAIRGRVAYEFSDAATLSYIAGFRNYSGDEDSHLTLPIIYQSFLFEDEADTQSHELRLNGEIGSVIYQVGAFYFKEELNRENGFWIPIPFFTPGSFLSYFGRDVESESWSAFGQVEVPLTDTLTAVGGLRYTENDRNATFQNASPFGAGPPDPALFGAGTDRKDFANLAYAQTLDLDPPSEDKVTWLAGLNYKPTDDQLIYGKVATGFKGGGFDSIGSYKPETNTAYELGWKQTLGDAKQYTLNLAAFLYDYKDLQVSVLLDTTVGGQTFNAGEAEIWGLEGSFAVELTENDHLELSLNYLDAEYKELLAQFNVYCVACVADINGIGDLDPVTPGVQQPDFEGNKPAFSPDLIATLGFDHVFNLGDAGSLTARISTMYKSSYYTDFFNYSDGKQESYTRTDVSLEYSPPSGKLSVQLYGRNLEDERPLTYGSFVSAGPDDIYNWQFGEPRTWGVRVNYDF